MYVRTCRLVACEQLPETIARAPAASGNTLERVDGAMSKFAGRPIATPEPAVTSGRSFNAGPIRSKSSLLMASTIAIPTPWLRSSSIRRRIAASPAATTL